MKDVEGKNLKRISKNREGQVVIVGNDTNYSEKCAIEDLLSPEAFLKALKGAEKIFDAKQKNFIESLSIKYPEETGTRAFGIDEVQKQQLKEIFRLDGFKLEVANLYTPTEDEKNKFINTLNLD